MKSMFEKLPRDIIAMKSVRQMREHLRTPLYRNAYLLILNQGGSAILGFLYWTIAARFYSTQAVGRSSAIISTLILLSMLAELSLKSAMQRFIPRAGAQVTRVVALTYGIGLLAAGILAVGFFIITGALHLSDNLFAGMSLSTLVLFVLAAMLWTVFFIQDGILMGLRQAQWVLWENTLYNVAKIVLLVIGISGALGDGIVASWFLPTTVTILIANVLIFTRFIPDFKKMKAPPGKPVQRREVITSVAGDHVGTILAETSTRLLPLIVVNLLGSQANAFFYQAWLISSMIYAVSVNEMASFTVEVSSNLSRVSHFSRKAMRHMLLLILPMALVLWGVAPLILQIYGQEYALQGTSVLRWLALAALPYGVNAWFLSYARVRANIWSIIWNQGLQGIITVGLSYEWMQRYGIASIGLAWLIAQTVTALIVGLRTWPIFFGKDVAVDDEPSTEIVTPADNRHELTRRLERVFLIRNGSQPGISTPSVYLFLSPHLDDAVLSCGGFIARLAAAGERVVIATAFTADLPAGSPISWLALRNLRAWGLDGSAFSIRRQEDLAATRQLGVETIHFGLLDAMYRCRQDGSPYYPQNIVGVPIDPQDEEIIGNALREAFTQLNHRFSAFGNVWAFSPLCAGRHVDHLLVRSSAEAVFGANSLFYYEEQPYVSRSTNSHTPADADPDVFRGSWLSTCVPLTPQDIEVRIAAAGCYKSQIPGLFPSPVERGLEVFSARLPFIGKPLWDLHWRSLDIQKSTERMARTLRGSIHRTGGELYWFQTLPGA